MIKRKGRKRRFREKGKSKTPETCGRELLPPLQRGEGGKLCLQRKMATKEGMGKRVGGEGGGEGSDNTRYIDKHECTFG